MNEHGASAKLRKQLLAKGLVFHWKIHDPYAGGVPDHFIEGVNRDLWIESKHLKELPKKPSTIIDLCNEKKFLSLLQQEWLRRRDKKRHDCAVLVTCDDGTAALFLNRTWEIPYTTEDFRAKLQPFKDIVEQIVALT
ncbi:MAG: hypothetical protein E6R03_14595 [Hyphomicrobiaceae bacterium]|nr:MAG: hypothetical protein E6R03_14595 [Hyphomicrobiaceae bacterium]